MGDGRYYTGEQFFSILYLTTIIIFMVISIMLYLYKGSRNRFLLAAYAFLACSALFSFLEQVTVSVHRGRIAVLLTAILFMFANNLFIHYLIPHKHNRVHDIIHGILLIYLCSALYYEDLLIKAYNFEVIIYAKGYLLILMAYLAFYILYTIMLSRIPSRYVIVWIMPLFIIIIAIASGDLRMKYAFYSMYLLGSVSLNLISEYTTVYKINPTIFSDIKDLIMDYVFITDNDGSVIFKNSHLLESDDFREFHQFDPLDIESIF